jgi:hypothetical protein
MTTVDVPQIWDFFAKRPRNLCEICCVFEDSAAIMKWGAMEKVHRRWGIRPLGLKSSATARRVAPWSLVPNSACLTRPHTGQASPRGCYRTVVSSPELSLMADRRALFMFVLKNGDGLISPLCADAPVRFLQNRRTDTSGDQGRRLLSQPSSRPARQSAEGRHDRV